MSNILLEVKDLKKYYKVPKGMLHAVDGVSFNLEKGKTLGDRGRIRLWKNDDWPCNSEARRTDKRECHFRWCRHTETQYKQEMRHMRRNMQLIFQDPFSSLNPRKTITQTIEEPIILANYDSGS